jgi:hypothetical protein
MLSGCKRRQYQYQLSAILIDLHAQAPTQVLMRHGHRALVPNMNELIRQRASKFDF